MTDRTNVLKFQPLSFVPGEARVAYFETEPKSSRR